MTPARLNASSAWCLVKAPYFEMLLSCYKHLLVIMIDEKGKEWYDIIIAKAKIIVNWNIEEWEKELDVTNKQTLTSSISWKK